MTKATAKHRKYAVEITATFQIAYSANHKLNKALEVTEQTLDQFVHLALVRAVRKALDEHGLIDKYGDLRDNEMK